MTAAIPARERIRGIGSGIGLPEDPHTGASPARDVSLVEQALGRPARPVESWSGDTRARRFATGGVFVLDGPVNVNPRWGRDDEVAWAEGEPLIIASPTGVGKTTVAVQLVGAMIGVDPPELLGLPVTPARKVLYLAMDRPRQIRRAMARRFHAGHRAILEERLTVWKGPLEKDLGRYPEHLADLAIEFGADVVVVDSLKDAAVKISEDEVGGNVNRALQTCATLGIDVLVLHHQRKGQGDSKPKTLEDVYGSTWITAGAGSVIVLWGQAGDSIVDWLHLKQPAAEIGPWKLEHDHYEGRTVVSRGFDALRYLRLRPNGASVKETAQAMFEVQEIKDKERLKAKRTLDGLVRRELATKRAGQEGGVGGSTGARYYATPKAVAAA